MKHFFILIFSVVFIGVGNFVTAQNNWSLQKCIDYAIENNIQIKQQALATQYGENQVRQAKSNRLPDLNASFSNDYSFGRSLTYLNTYKNVNSASVSGSLATSLTLFNGITLTNTIKQRELDLQATIQDLQKAKDDIMLSIAASYLEILFAEELTHVTKAQIEMTQQQLDRTKELVNAGSLAKGALLEIEAQKAKEELQLVNDENRVKLGYLALYHEFSY